MAKQKKFRVWAKVTSYCYLDVECKNENEAIDIAENTDGGIFTPDDFERGDFEIMEEDVEVIDKKGSTPFLKKG